MKTYTEQEVIALFEQFEQDRSRFYDVDAREILPLNRWLFENGLEKSYVGKTFQNNNTLYDVNYRVVKIDGSCIPITSDFISDRLNFEVENGIITKQTYG